MQILERTLTANIAGKRVAVPIRIFRPEPSEGGGWYCRYEIDWPNGRRSFQAAGVDGIQSLLCAMQMIAAEVYTSDLHRQGRLKWLEAGDGYGLPLPFALRDMYEGADKSL